MRELTREFNLNKVIAVLKKYGLLITSAKNNLSQVAKSDPTDKNKRVKFYIVKGSIFNIDFNHKSERETQQSLELVEQEVF